MSEITFEVGVCTPGGRVNAPRVRTLKGPAWENPARLPRCTGIRQRPTRLGLPAMRRAADKPTGCRAARNGSGAPRRAWRPTESSHCWS